MNPRIELAALLLAGAVVAVTACGGNKTAPPSATTAEQAETPLPPSELETQLPEGVRESLMKPFTGDYDEMVKRRLIRIGVAFNRTFYFVDKGVQRGVAADYGLLVEERINTSLKTSNKNKVLVFFVPLPRELLLPSLVEGKVDFVAAGLTMTPEREQIVNFTNPTRMNVSEILVTGPTETEALASVEDLSGRRVFVRTSSSYYQSLLALNEKLEAQGKPAVAIETAAENLEDDDLLEMVNAGLLPAIVVDDYVARFWKKVFPHITVHEDVALRTGGTLAIAIRKNNPHLSAALNRFMGKYGLGTAFGDNVERKYLVSTKYVKNASSEAERAKFLALVQLFRKYSERYKLDFLLMAAQGYQESMLNQNARSEVGAIGVMQIMPATGKDMNVGNIEQLEPNIHAGVRYMRVTEDAFFKDEPMDDLNRALFTFASYNAGPGRVRQLRREAEKRGLNPNVWFGNVEQIASERIGRETVTYVANIYKYYIAYRLVVEESQRRVAAKDAVKAKEGR